MKSVDLFQASIKGSELHLLQSPILISGGAYAGKSAAAIQCFDPDDDVAVIGTYSGTDQEMLMRIDDLRQLRPPQWIECPSGDDLVKSLKMAARSHQGIIIDSINQWLAEQMVELSNRYSPDQVDQIMEQKCHDLEQAVRSCQRRSVIVTSEVGSGLSPADALGRVFRKRGAMLNVKLASICKSVLIVHMGIPVLISGRPLTEAQSRREL